MYTERYRSHHVSKELKKKYQCDVDKELYVRELLNAPARTRRAIYIHVPFCNKVCTFCPFYRPDALKRREYHQYLIDEIHSLQGFSYMEAPVEVINFGGGTPTALRPEQIRQVFTALRETFQIAPDAEISLESSASELTDEMLEVLTEAGVNRLSIGIQSFQDEYRKVLGRRGSGEFAASRVQRAMEYGIQNTGIDLLYNIPGQTDITLEKDLAMVREIAPSGISFYSLMIHPNTPLEKSLSPEVRAAMARTEHEYALFQQVLDGLRPRGYRMLELTKLVRDGLDRYEYMQLRHSGGSCIAIGCGAGGKLDNYLYHNNHPREILSEQAPICSRGRVMDPRYQILDAFIYELQKARVDLRDYSEKLECDLEGLLEPEITRMEKEGLIHFQNGVLSFTDLGVFWGNNIVEELMRKVG